MMVISNGTREGSWHVGEDMNIPAGRVITFQVDGDELAEQIRATVKQARGIPVPVTEIAALLRLDRSTLYRTYLNDRR